MGSWFVSIYRYTRNYRRRRPFSGGIFAFFCLNLLFIMQVIGIMACYYTFVFIFIQMISNDIRACIYLIIYHVLLFFFVWSLCRTYFTPSKKPPGKYYIDKATDELLKSVTPLINGVYKSFHSNQYQIKQQQEILLEAANKKGLILAEIDLFNLLKYCYICGTFKPDRCRHCSCCDLCVLKFDHHCPFINKCISIENYKFFFLYIFYATILTFWSGLTSIEGIIIFFSNSLTFNFNIFMLFLSVIFHCSICVFVFGNLLFYHLDLIGKNQTTCEQFKGPKFRDDVGANYDVGRNENFEQVFGWGLWMLPIRTYMEDGVHYKIKYSNHFNGTVKILRCKCIL